MRHRIKPIVATRPHYGPTNRTFRRSFVTFCCALLLESVGLQLMTTAGDVQLVTSNQNAASMAMNQSHVSGAHGQVLGVEITPTPSPTATPAPTPTTIVPKLNQTVLAAAPAQPLINPNLVFNWPLRSYTITQYYSAYHTALDLADPTGTPMYATAPGIVTGTGYLMQGGGLMVKIDHGAGYVSYYAHLSAITATVGQKVDNGVEIGKVGATGWATGPHLHFMIYLNNKPINPLTVLK